MRMTEMGYRNEIERLSLKLTDTIEELDEAMRKYEELDAYCEELEAKLKEKETK